MFLLTLRRGQIEKLISFSQLSTSTMNIPTKSESKITRYLKSLTLIVFLSIALAPQAYSQCIDTTCFVDQLIMNTGYDFNTNGPLPITSGLNVVQDPFWLLINAPTSNGPINLGSPAFVIGTNRSWSEMPPLTPSPPSRYISAFPTSGSNEANISGTPYTFQHKLCVCKDSTEIIFSDSIHVDNRVQLKLLGPGLPLGGTILSQYNSTIVANFRNPPDDDGAVTIMLDKGTYYLQAETRNDNAGSPMGFNLAGTLKANKKSISNETCCNNGAFVSGYKYLDNNCNNIIDGGDPVSQNWTIELFDPLTSSVIATTTTDVTGYYFFNITTPGNYIIRELITVGGFVQTFPPGNIHNITITGTEIISNLNFANCCQDCANFQQSSTSIQLSCFTEDNLLIVKAPSGVLPTDEMSLDINCDGVYEVTGIAGNAAINYNLPHYGTYDIKVKISRKLCDYPCDIIIEKTIVAEEIACGVPSCYEYQNLDFACIASTVTSYDSTIVIGGYVKASGQVNIDRIVSYDGATTRTLAASPVVGDIIEVEPYKGDLYAMAYTGSQIRIYKYNSVFWTLERTIGAPTLSSPAGPEPYNWTLPEMQHLDGSLFVAFLKNLPSGKTSHSIHQYDGSAWTVLPDPGSSFTGFSLNRYFQIGQYNGKPMIVREECDSSIPVCVSYLAEWDGTSWVNITPPFQLTHNSPDFFYDGIFNADHNDDVIVVVGNFDQMDNIPGTKFVAQFDLNLGLWKPLGNGATSNTATSPALNDVAVIDQDIFVGGVGVITLGNTPVANFGWHNGTVWNSLSFDGFLISDFEKIKQADGGCRLVYVGECGIGEIRPCCIYDSLLLTNVETGPAYYKAHGQIITESTITNTANVTYNGGQGVLPRAPFNVQAGARVTSLTDGCDNCCPRNPLTELPFLQPFVGNPAYSITKCFYNGDCVYRVTDFCQVSDGETAYYDCLGNKICSDFGFTSNCPSTFTVTGCQVLQSC